MLIISFNIKLLLGQIPMAGRQSTILKILTMTMFFETLFLNVDVQYF